MLFSILLLCFCGNSLIYAVHRPPSIYKQPTNKEIYYRLGDWYVELPCVAHGIPKPRYFWQRDGKAYNPGAHDGRVIQLPDQGTLFFNTTLPEDEAVYQCFADNGYGISASVKIKLRMGKLMAFANEPDYTHTVEAGRDLTLPCVPPQSVPKAKAYWALMKEHGRFQPVYFDKRVSMDLEGSLRFANLQKSDEQDGRAYHCIVANSFMRAHSIGPGHVVKVLESKQQTHPPQQLWTSHSNNLFIKGQPMRLKCIFSGYPTPNIFWKNNQGTFSDQARFKSYGQELYIENVKESDEGIYECMNQIDDFKQRITKLFDVKIESAPYWVQEPAIVEANINDKATFVCKADGVPKPKHTWYINGVPIEGNHEVVVRDPRIFNNNRFLMKNPNTLTLANLTLEDHMNIQCNASNRHGYVFSDVYLNVVPSIPGEAPTIIKPPPAEIKVAENKPVAIDCVVKGEPYPNVTWYRGYQRIAGRFQIMPNGSLHIQAVRMADTGDYHCRAKNVHGEVRSSVCRLIIRRKTKIMQFPVDMVVLAEENVRFSCSGITDYKEVSNMELYWEKDDTRVLRNDSRLIQDMNSLTIRGANVDDSGMYTCVVTNGLDEDRAYAILTVNGRPCPPSWVEIERCLDFYADIKWTKCFQYDIPVDNFIIQYNTSLHPDQWISVKTINSTQNKTTISLMPWKSYTFRVMATNKYGISLPSFHTQTTCTTPSAQPFKNPKNVRSVGNIRNTLTIKWTPMNESEHNGPGFKYLLTVEERGSSMQNTYLIDDWGTDAIEIPVNIPYRPYLVKLQARNDLGDAQERPKKYTLYSFEHVPNVWPMEVNVTDVGNTFATVTWKWDSFWLGEEGEMTKILGQLIGFRIQYWCANEMLNTMKEIDVPVGEVIPRLPPTANMLIPSTFLLKNLTQYSNMKIQMRVLNNFYVGPQSDVIDFYTYAGVNRPPKIYKQSEHRDIFYKAGELAQIPCAANGIPEARFLWKRNGEPYNPSSHGDRIAQQKGEGTIVFYSPEGKDEGIYQCFADNGLGISASIEIRFRMATLESFAEEPATTHKVHAGNYLTLSCVPPRSYPPGEVFWVLEKADMQWEPIPLSNRITMDTEGRLRFTNVINSDEQDGNSYRCMVINQLLRNSQAGPAHYVDVLESREPEHPYHVLWTSPSHMLFIKGDMLKLKCIFAGIPTPDVYWKKLEQDSLPERALLMSFGQELHIENIRESDAGQYQCESRITGEQSTRLYKIFDIRIESAPFWVEEPSDVEASVNQNASFVCKADGIPKPMYNWYINGVPLEELNTRFIKTDENSISISKLTLEDHMNIQCNASNKHGYLFSDVYLNVIPAIPTILNHPPAGINTTEGRDVIIDCLVSGKPYPKVTWYKDQGLITEERFKILSHGNLNIQNVMIADAGDYRCVAGNTHGEVTSSACKLQVGRKTISIAQYPFDLGVTAGENAIFTCSASTGDEDNIKVYWEKDGQRIWTKKQSLTPNVWNNILTISETKFSDSGVYTCIFTNGIDEERASASLTVYDDREPLLMVEIERCSGLSADIKWTMDNGNNVPVHNLTDLTVQYNTSFNPDQWISVETVNSLQTTATVTLSPWANYTFRVIATTENGARFPSVHTKAVCTTSPDIPYDNPSGVQCVGDTRNKLKIKWTPMNELEHNGPGFNYKLMVKEHGQNFWNAYIIDNWRNDTFEMPSYKPYTRHYARVFARNALGDARIPSSGHYVYSYEDVPRVRPMDVEVTDKNKTYAIVSWKWDYSWLEEEGATTEILGQLKGFQIEYWRTYEKEVTYDVVIPVEDVKPTDPPRDGALITSSFSLKKLPTNSSLQVQMRVMNSYYTGPPSDTIGYTSLKAEIRPPHINRSSDKEIYYRSGEAVVILCEANGNPKPWYLWKRDGKTYEPSNHGDHVTQTPSKGSMILKRADIRDEGIYQCFANNGFGTSASDKIHLKMAKINTYSNTDALTHRAHAGEDLTLPCDPPLIDPPAHIRWVERISDYDWVPINLNKRVTMDSEGRLRFTHVQNRDELNGHPYSCRLTSRFWSTQVYGPEHFVKVEGSREHKFAPHELWTSPSDQVVHKGKTLMLKCIFAGNPTPDVQWERVDGNLPDRASVLNSGLFITDIQESDAGQYECTGRNTGFTQEAKKVFHVVVQFAPIWVQEPSNVEARENDDATFVCEADGVPKPEYTWYINGDPIKAPDDENSFTVKSVTLQDRMNIQCNASNTHGYVFSDVYLNILQ